MYRTNSSNILKRYFCLLQKEISNLSRSVKQKYTFVILAYLVEKLNIISIVVVGEVEHASRGVRPDPLQTAISIGHSTRLRTFLEFIFLRHRSWDNIKSFIAIADTVFLRQRYILYKLLYYRLNDRTLSPSVPITW